MITVTNFAGVWVATIAFKNKTHGENPDTVVWVCENQEVYENRLSYLQSQEHIEIVQHGLSQVKSETQDSIEKILAA